MLSDLNICTAMEIDPNIIINTQITLTKHFMDSIADVKFFFEGQRESGKDYPRYELRVDGPFTRKLHGVNEHIFEVNTLISVSTNDEDAFALERVIAKVYAAFKESIILIDESENKLGHLEMSFEGRRDRIEVSRFGKIHQDQNLEQASIEAHYKYEES